MAPKDKVITFRPDNDIHAAMTSLRAALGIPFSEQIRRALREWLAERPEAWPPPKGKGVMKSGRKRAVSGKRL